jgi:hypothetical protein
MVRDLSLTTTVSPNLATMLTIGAQANGYVTGQDSTALSVMNYGLKDRVKEEWVEPTNPNNYPLPSSTPAFIAPLQPQPQTTSINFITGAPQQTAPNQPTQPTEPAAPTLNVKYKDVISSFNRFIQEMATNVWNQEDITAFTNSIQSFAEYNQAEETLKQRQLNPLTSSPNIGFLPFDLTLTIDGLSGMKIYQKFIADTEFLPSNYPQSLEFLIKGITHEIKDNQWITTLESLAVPKNPFGTKDKFNVGAKISGQSSITQRAAGAAEEPRSTDFTSNFIPSSPATTSQIQAFRTAYDKFWATYSQDKSKCARYSAKLASIYVKVLRNQPLRLPTGKPQVEAGAGGGNAGTPSHRALIRSYGYTETVIGTNLTKSQMINLFDNTANFGSFSPGDVVTYKSNDGAHFHSIVYTGGYGGSYWTTDNKLNFYPRSVGFVYKSASQNSYSAWLLKAPKS